MEKINLEKVRGHLAALNKELGVKALDEDVIELLGDYIHDFIYRKLENISITAGYSLVYKLSRWN